jgi:hypothetical protein
MNAAMAGHSNEKPYLLTLEDLESGYRLIITLSKVCLITDQANFKMAFMIFPFLLTTKTVSIEMQFPTYVKRVSYKHQLKFIFER